MNWLKLFLFTRNPSFVSLQEFSSMTSRSNSKILASSCSVLRGMSTVTCYSESFDTSVIECPLVVKDRTYKLMMDKDEDEFNEYLRFRCATLSDREDRRDCVKANMKYGIEELEVYCLDKYTERLVKRNRMFIDNNLSNASYWLSLLRTSTRIDCIKLKQKLENAELTELNVSLAIAKVFVHLDDCYIHEYHGSSYKPEDVISVLKSVNLSDTDYKSLQILFNNFNVFTRTDIQF